MLFQLSNLIFLRGGGIINTSCFCSPMSLLKSLDLVVQQWLPCKKACICTTTGSTWYSTLNQCNAKLGEVTMKQKINHIIQCWSEARTMIQMRWSNEVQQYLNSSYTSNEISQSNMNGLKNWFGKPLRNLYVELSNETRKAVNEQNQIGWDHFRYKTIYQLNRSITSQ
jgi:hypothetical protein